MRFPGLLLLALGALPGAAATRVALSVEAARGVGTGAAAVSADWHGVLTAALAEASPDIELVERAELARLWTERERTPAYALSGPLGVDHYLHFRQVAPARWIVTRIDAATGGDRGSFTVDAATPSDASALADAARRLLAAPTPAPAPSTARAPRLAVVESADAAGDTGLFVLAARLRAALADEGLVILDRTLTREIAVEQNDAARGLLAAASPVSLLGIDHYLELSPSSARLVRIADGTVLGLRPRADAAPDEVNILQRWALPLLDRPVSAATDYLPQVEVEALAPFLRGLALHDAGRQAEAVAEFTRAYELNGRFREAYEWSARCHDALGLTETAAAIRRFLNTEFLENLSAPTGRVAPVDGLVFLGIAAPSPSVADALSAHIASLLARRPELGLRLPTELERLRTEFDWALLGVPPDNVPPAPALLTRWILGAEATLVAGELRLRFTRRDTLGLLPAEIRELPLPDDPAGRHETLARFLAAWPAGSGSPSPSARADTAPAPAPAPSPTTTPDLIERLAAEITATGSESVADAARLRLLLADPAHPLGVVRRSATADEPLASFLEHGRRADAIRRLPAASVARRWLELFRALEYLDSLGPGPLYSGENLDARAELARLAAAAPEDGPGLVARYHLLFLAQASLAPAEIAAEAETLRAALRTPPDRLADCAGPFDLALASLARLARLASLPRPDDLAGLDKFTAPTDLPVFRVKHDGRLACPIEAYAITRRTFAGLSTAEAAANARALLAINGRPRPRDFHFAPLLAAHPRSLALAQFCVLRLARSLRGITMPDLDADDWTARRDQARAALDYALDTLADSYAWRTSPAALDTTSDLATALLGVLGHHRLREWFPAETHAEVFRRLVAAEEAARARVDFPPHFNSNTFALQQLSPEAIRPVHADDFHSSGIWIADPEPIRRSLLAREIAFLDPTDKQAATRRSWWWLAARWETKEAFTAPERAALLARPLGAILRDAPISTDDALLGRHFELGLFLLQGRRHADAERVLAPIAALEPAPGASRDRFAYVGNARFRLAQIQHLAGRTPEALATARGGLALAEGRSLPYYEEDLAYRHTESRLTAHFLRLLAELRAAPERLRLDDRVGFVRVPTPNGDNPGLVVYYRLPPPSSGPAPRAPARVLVLSPATNTDPLETLSLPGPWTDFADARGLVLVAPRFHVSDGASRADHLFTHARFASVWSGDALLRALDEIATRTPLDASRILLHGQASGSTFASHFAAWRPDRVAAIALSQGNHFLANQPLPGLRAPEAQRSIAYWIGANPWNNHDIPGSVPRHVYVQDFAGRLRAAGVAVEWAEFPSSSSAPSEAMEDAARAFLDRHLHP